MATNSASLAATSVIGISAVSRPFREASIGLTSRRARWERAGHALGVPKAPCQRRPLPGGASAAPGHQHDPDTRLRQALVDSAEKRLAEGNVILAEPDRTIA